MNNYSQTKEIKNITQKPLFENIKFFIFLWLFWMVFVCFVVVLRLQMGVGFLRLRLVKLWGRGRSGEGGRADIERGIILVIGDGGEDGRAD